MMDMDLSGKTALVTGSTRGIGLATAKGLAYMGASVIVNGRTPQAFADAIASTRQTQPEADIMAAVFDLGTLESCSALIKQHPAVDILVNNLGIYDAKTILRDRR